MNDAEALARALLRWNGLGARADAAAPALAAGMTAQRAAVQKAYDDLPAAAEPAWFAAELKRGR
ncbi:hypothetical protein [Reyranella sp. CPCC 100927]|uniref:hypothetical protein n=1 Tax=Reyranella sp. CPCC 100927 TaxID=2599616 RepID=UPI0011B48E15|nr:hypothetical protein [Reyranella sp. CPCC 100927]TWT10266.1 hypothetical protein FQU96_19480 [Reyranella sp. CPCC 100927]